MTTIRTLLAVALLALAGPAWAQFYVWGAGGSAKLDARTLPNVSGRDTVSAQLGAGWGFNRFLAVEAGYLSTPSYDALTPSLNAFWSADGYTLAAVGSIPLGPSWSIIGKLGVWDAKAEFRTVTVPAGARTTTKTDLGSRPLLGFGIEYSLGEHLHLRALYEQIDGKASQELHKLEMLSFGFVLRY